MSSMTIEDQLESEALTSNKQLLDLDIRSKYLDWNYFVIPLRSRDGPVYLQGNFDLIGSHREPIDERNRREILICHDMMGNYLEDRLYRSSKKYDDYRFYHWSGIDYFCYFSHRYVTIPPCNWINAAHKHGVRVLGTFITEGFNGSRLLHEVLQSTEMINRIVDSLVRVCTHFKFEGWLVNVECKVESNFLESLIYFLERLRTEITSKVYGGYVIWYDSVADTGEILFQNEINSKNVHFLKAANAVLINYMWNDRSLETTLKTCAKHQIPHQRAFVGIDVFGRGQIAKFQTKQTLARIVRNGMSTGFFAPAWTFETLQQFGYNIRQPHGNEAVNDAFLQRNDKFWSSLWNQLATHPYNTLPFYTDFCLGSGKYRFTFGKRSTHSDEGRFFNLSLQSLQPSIPLHRLALRHYGDGFNGGSCLQILQYDKVFRLFATNFHLNRRGLIFAYAFKLEPNDGELDCVLRVCLGGNDARDCYIFLGDYYDTLHMQKGRCYISPFKAQYNSYLTGPLESTRIPKNLNPTNSNGWRVRYYVITFDVVVQVMDIGVLYRRTAYALSTAYLGAIYLNEFDRNSLSFPMNSNYANIKLVENNLLN